MKKIVSLLTLATAFCVSCSDYLDVNTDPNNPTDVPIELIMPAAQVHLVTTLGSELFNTAGYFTQYLEQHITANQYDDVADYSFTEDEYNDVYNDIYARVLEDCRQITIKASAEGAWGDYFAATVVRCYALQIVVDAFDNAPYSEALQGLSNTAPKWDAGADVYAGLLKELDAAEAKLDVRSSVSGDYFLDGDVDKWVEFANALRLKILMRGSFAQDNSVAVKALIDAGGFPAEDIAFDSFEDTTDKRNPWYSSNKVGLSGANVIAASPIISMYNTNSDVRVTKMFEANGDDAYVGSVPGSKNYYSATQQKAMKDKLNKPVYNATMPVSLMSKAEVDFFLAEAYIRFYGNDAAAKAAYESGVNSNFAYHGLDEATAASTVYAAGKYGEWSGSDAEKLEKIGVQKWMALGMVNHWESWCEVRRTGYPAQTSVKSEDIFDAIVAGGAEPASYTAGNMIAPVISITGNTLIQRVYYPATAVQLNANTPDQAKLSDSIWWAK